MADLPYAAYLQAHAGELADKGDYDTLLFEGLDFSTAANGARFIECAFTGVAFGGIRFRECLFNDVWVQNSRWMGTDLVDSKWLDAEVVANVFAGVELFGSELRRVAFHQCKFDSINGRGSNMEDVQFVDCLLKDVDLSGATLSNVAFTGSRLNGVRLAKAQMDRVDLSGATALELTDGHGDLKGATISWSQLVDIAPMFANALGVAVK
ncbi:pentapeptide repeat-containing protein [Streptomyces tsukubensis]|uniref:Pentapeptide repeat-containing protein n=1 Tax=Streptomyces tsukubensis TaxID=83656 RepID=A0A1V4A414_9ACTN|nr:pentapeptide repeat-containing protein [Streptomyces tsukubensis]OON75176.1 hypothetical protein B1H18_23805 [Streptomyces tsukubensis]QFR96077.1 pentapeptide repeat-containing protein [Streptomyces tsukubensis]